MATKGNNFDRTQNDRIVQLNNYQMNDVNVGTGVTNIASGIGTVLQYRVEVEICNSDAVNSITVYVGLDGLLTRDSNQVRPIPAGTSEIFAYGANIPIFLTATGVGTVSVIQYG